MTSLPPFPTGSAEEKRGWPWNGALPPPVSDRSWPRITVVTPNYNGAAFLEETIRSVLLQGYPNLEYIVIDDGSTDNSIEIIRKYEPWLAYWTTQPNQGQSAAINRGFQRSTGEIIAFLNSDDTYLPGALFRVARAIDPGRNHAIVMGEANAVKADGKLIRKWVSRVPALSSLVWQYRLCRWRGVIVMPIQPSVFWHRSVLDTLGLLREDLKYAMDYDYWLRALENGFRFYPVREVLSTYRFHPGSNSNRGWPIFYPEWRSVERACRERMTGRQRLFAQLWWWFVLAPLSLVTLPVRVLSYFCLGVRRG